MTERHAPGEAQRRLRADQFALAAACTAKATEAVVGADALNEDHALAVKNMAQASLAATQAWLTSTRGHR